MSDLPNRIRELRKARGWELKDLAERINASIAMVSELERGNRSLTHHWMKVIARALGVEPGNLLLEGENGLSLSAEERALVERYRAADPQQRAQLQRMADVIAPYAAEPERKRTRAA